jgi:four helix bundle protein
MSVQSHRDLIVWQKAMDLVVEVYRLTERFPKTETYRLVSQITRAAASVPANIAEGNARNSSREYAQFLSIAKGSLMETETFLTLGVRLGYVTDSDAKRGAGLITEISKMLTSLRIKMKSREQANRKRPVS